MKHEPQIQQRAAQPYVGIRVPVTMERFAKAVDTRFPEVFGWLAKHGITPTGPPFVRYVVIDMETELEIELAVPVGDHTPNPEVLRRCTELRALQVALCLIVFREDFGDNEGWDEGIRSMLGMLAP